MTEKTKQMTQVAALETAVEALKEFGTTDKHRDAAAVIEHILEKRRAPRSRKPKAETVAFREELISRVLHHHEAELPTRPPVVPFPLHFQHSAAPSFQSAETVQTAAMRERLGDETLKPQKIANNIRVLEKDGTVVRHRSEKPSGKDTFSLA